MKKVPFIIFTILFGAGISSFNLQNEKEDQLIGVWVYSGSDDGMITYFKSESFKEEKSGIEFKKSGKLNKRQNAGWCGTPPITYKNYKGNWKYTSDSTLTIEYDYWGGKAEEDWQVIELSADSLKVKRVEYRTERRK